MSISKSLKLPAGAKPFDLIKKGVVFLLVGGLLVYNFVLTERFYIPFDQTAWLTDLEGSDGTRKRMVPDLMDEHLQPGTSREAVEATLGPPAKRTAWTPFTDQVPPGGTFVVYPIDRARSDYGAWYDDYLVLVYDENSVLQTILTRRVVLSS